MPANIEVSAAKFSGLVLVFVFLIHVLATFLFFPPLQIFKAEPLRYSDHPVHTHRVFMYRQGLLESGLPWGYDPAVAAGFVMRPSGDAGAKPQQFLGALLLFFHQEQW